MIGEITRYDQDVRLKANDGLSQLLCHSFVPAGKMQVGNMDDSRHGESSFYLHIAPERNGRVLRRSRLEGTAPHF